MDDVNNYIVTYLVDNHLVKKEDSPIYQYGFSILFLKITYWISFLIFGLFFDVFIETVIFLLMYSWIRVYAGGYHASSVSKCYIISFGTVIVNSILCINYEFFESLFIDELIFIISWIYIFIFCPVDNNNKRLDMLEKKRFRKRTHIILIIYLAALIFLLFNPLILPEVKITIEYIVTIESVMMFAGKTALKKGNG